MSIWDSASIGPDDVVDLVLLEARRSFTLTACRHLAAGVASLAQGGEPADVAAAFADAAVAALEADSWRARYLMRQIERC